MKVIGHSGHFIHEDVPALQGVLSEFFGGVCIEENYVLVVGVFIWYSYGIFIYYKNSL